MPEGHVIHRAARLHSARFGGETVRAWSPQGRFSEGAARVDGTVLERAEARGKHLFYTWSSGDILHVHLGLFGKFKIFATDPPEPSEATRLAIAASTGTLYLAGATIVELIDPDSREAVEARLGPDPLAPRPGDAERFATLLSRRSVAIGSALLDQRAIAGVGNVYRAELLFLAGIDPATPAKVVDEAQSEALWELAREHLAVGERSGRIVTVDPDEVGADSRTSLRRAERLYVYHRDGEGCRRCGTEISRGELGGRGIWWCSRCQS
ncbi:MAG: Fpg/Nei family DNA glycosylase [Acidimicrobiia bacterium]|nr:Fpg/Nei family DNA glycosylase [Acidimicrobiia bacterium]